MTNRKLTISYSAYASSADLPEQSATLLAAAVQALDHAYAPYSNFYVGAAILLKNGEIISGANQENAAYPLCLCAERVALAAAHAQYPNVAVSAIAVTVKNPKQVIDAPAAPCGACRQVICETERRYGQPIQVLLQGETGEIFAFASGKAMLPLSFDGSYL